MWLYAPNNNIDLIMMSANLKKLRSLAASLLLLSAYVPAASAEWLTLFGPKQTSVEAVGSDGRDAFSAFGCVECHGGLSDQGYQSGFRVLGVDAEPETIQAKMSAPYSPVEMSSKKLLLGDREYWPSGENSAVFLRQLHRGVPGVQPSLTLLNEASKADQNAVLDYVLMF